MEMNQEAEYGTNQTQTSNEIKNELVSVRQKNDIDLSPGVDQETHGTFKKEKIELEENSVWNIDGEQDFNEEVHTLKVRNYFIGKTNGVNPIKQDVNVNLNTDILFDKCIIAVNRECNISDNINLHNIENKMKNFKNTRCGKTKTRGTLLNMSIKQMDPSSGIIICKVCGNMYTKQVEFVCHISANHYFKLKKLCTKINNDKINADIKDEIEIVEHELKEELQENENHTYQFEDINTNEIVVRDHKCNCSNTGDNPPKCKFCLKYCKHEVLNRQCRIDGKRFKCDICLKSFSKKIYLNRHLPFHTIKKPFKCKICLKSYLWKKYLNKHMRFHTREKPFKCEVCIKSYSQKNTLNAHMRYHTREISFQCEICSKHFSRKYHLNVHLRCHTGEKPFKCAICSKYFSRKNHLNVHLRCHSREKPFKCEICFKSFTQKGHLNAHLRCHTGDKPFECEICLKSFSCKSSLNKHLRCHTGEKPFKCEICFKSFSQKGHLNAHLRCHTGEMPFKCEICLKSFPLKGTLNTHLRCHTGEIPFKCEICFKSFLHKGNLNAHLRFHTGEKPFKCEICLKSFTRRDNLTAHMGCHTGEKPFQCEICLKSFLCKSTLNAHVRRHTEENHSKHKN